MKICIPSTGKELDSPMDNRFGRAQYFVVFDTETEEIKVLDNPGKTADRGAGVSAAQVVLDEGPDVIVCANLGGHAKEVLEESEVKVVEFSGGTVRQAIEATK